MLPVKPIKIPFDSVVLAAVVAELQAYVGGKVQGVRQPDDSSFTLGVYASGREAMLLVNIHAVFARAHFVTKRPANPPAPPVFCATLRARIDGAMLTSVRQIENDRMLEMDFAGAEGTHRLVVELMGKHSNAMLLDEAGRVVAALKWVNRGQSARPIQSGMKYERPPVMGKSDGIGPSSPFFRQLVAAGGGQGTWSPVLSPGHGAYPFSVAPLGLTEFPRTSISAALEQHFDAAVLDHAIESLRSSLAYQLERVAFAREVALGDLGQAEAAGERAGTLQRQAELILAYGPAAPAGTSALQVYDYEGNALEIRVDPELTFKENANLLFERAKHAKNRLEQVREQIVRLQQDRADVLELLSRVQSEVRLDRLRDLQETAKQRRWLNQIAPTKKKEDRPYEGHRVREVMGPGGNMVIYGENAEGNDYLTLRVAKPNDWWLHVRGSTSAHVIIPTGNKPEKTSREMILFAAKVAVQHSPSKHAGYVPVDYTLKKYVRRPKGAAKGAALYTHEKTVHVDNG